MNKNLKNMVNKIPGSQQLKNIIRQEGNFCTYDIDAVHQLKFKKSNNKKIRLTLLITDMNKSSIYAGIKTALEFFNGFAEYIGAEKRILAMNASINMNEVYLMDGFKVADISSEDNKIVIDASKRTGELPVSENDIFIATMWNTVYSINNLSKWFSDMYNKPMPLIYMIQDYEPGFYPWSTRYLLAESTYKTDMNTIAVFNSFSLRDYFEKMGYNFTAKYAFTPKLNSDLKKYLINNKDKYQRKNQILIYGRPSRARNAFELIAMALNDWYKNDANAKTWKVYSAGQNMPDVNCSSGLVIKNVGKLTLEQYAKMMLETKIGISLMVSPHPSYPPLEMSTFGIRVITNTFANKNLQNFNSNIISLDRCTIEDISSTLIKLSSVSEPNEVIINDYLDESDKQWLNIYENIKNDLEIK